MKKLCSVQTCQPLEAYNACPDPETIEELAKTCHSCAFQCMYPYIRSQTGSGQKAADVFYHCWEKLIRHLHRGALVVDIRQYLFRAANNMLFDEEGGEA